MTVWLILGSCSEPAIPETGRVTPQLRVVGGDVLLRMIPGGGNNEVANRVASNMLEGDVRTARHLASVEWEGGRADLVVFRSLDGSICLSIAEGAVCGPGMLDAVGVLSVGEGDGHHVLVGVPEGGVEVVITTSEGRSVLPLDGLAWAGWHRQLGVPAEVTVFDGNSEELCHELIDPG